MSQLIIKIKRLPHGKHLSLPKYETPYSAGMDLFSASPNETILKPGEFFTLCTGICIALPLGYEAQIRSRSGLAAKHGVIVLNSPGTIDSDYRGEIGVILKNTSQIPFVVKPGMRIAQMVIAPVVQANWDVVQTLDETDRGDGGFGSTGV